MFGFGIFLFVPIIFGMTAAAFSAVRGERVTVKQMFEYFNGPGRSAAISHYAALTPASGILLALTFFGFYQALLYVLPQDVTGHPIGSVVIIMVSAFFYVAMQTFFSFATFIRIDTGVLTAEALKGSVSMVLKKPVYYMSMRYLFILRNHLVFGILIMQVLYHLNVTASPTHASGDPVMYSVFAWIVLLMVTGPLYDRMMVNMYLKAVG